VSARPAAAPAHARRARAQARAVALAASAAVVASGFAGSRPLPVLGWAAVFVFLTVESDLRCRRIANSVTFPALGLALGLAAFVGGWAGLSTALLGVATTLAIVLIPYAVGALGGGDVKAAMALGALLGPPATAALLATAIAIGAVIALARVAASGEAREVLRRWWVSAATSFATRRWVFLAAAPDSAADRGVPFAVALGLALAVVFGQESLQ